MTEKKFFKEKSPTTGRKYFSTTPSFPSLPKEDKLPDIDPHGQPVTLLEDPPSPITYADKVAQGLERKEERLVEVGRQLQRPQRRRRGLRLPE